MKNFSWPLVFFQKGVSLHPLFNKATYQRVLSSAGSEHLPYKQRVNGSNPLAPTKIKAVIH